MCVTLHSNTQGTQQTLWEGDLLLGKDKLSSTTKKPISIETPQHKSILTCPFLLLYHYIFFLLIFQLHKMCLQNLLLPDVSLAFQQAFLHLQIKFHTTIITKKLAKPPHPIQSSGFQDSNTSQPHQMLGGGDTHFNPAVVPWGLCDPSPL